MPYFSLVRQTPGRYSPGRWPVIVADSFAIGSMFAAVVVVAAVMVAAAAEAAAVNDANSNCSPIVSHAK